MYQVCGVPGKGLGLVATADLHRGGLVVRESPVVRGLGMYTASSAEDRP